MHHSKQDTPLSTPSDLTPKKSLPLSILVCSLAALLYVYEFMVRVAPSAMTDELMRSFHIQSVGLGFISALFFYGYTPMQIPAGLIYDRFSPRLLLSLATLLCALMTFCFAFTHSFIIACIARLLMGAAGAFAYIGALLIASRWFSAKRFSFYAGLVQFLGCMGAIMGQAPITILKGLIGWRQTNYIIAAIGVFFALIMWLIIRDYPEGHPHKKTTPHKKNHSLKRLEHVCHKKQTWWIGTYGFTCWAPITVFATLWGIPYLSNRFNVDTTQASTMIIAVWLGIAIASPLVGWWSNHIASRRIPMITCSIVGLIGALGILYLPYNSWHIALFFLSLIGFSAGSQVISFGLVIDNNPHSVLGTGLGFNNMAVIAGGVLLQPLVGVLLKLTWNGDIHHGIPFYSLHSFQIALSLVPLCSLAGIFIACYCIKETHCKSTFKKEQKPV